MEFVADYWYIWLLTLIGSIGYMLVHIFTKFKNTKDKLFIGAKTIVGNISDSRDMFSTIESAETAINEVVDSVSRGAWRLLVAQLIAFASVILLAIALVLNVAGYFK